MYATPPYPHPSGYGYYAPQAPAGYRYPGTPAPQPSKASHSRRASQQVPPGYYARASQTPAPQHTQQPQYVDPRFAAYYSSPLRTEHVSYFDDRSRGKARPARAHPEYERMHSGKQSRDPRYSAWQYGSSPDDDGAFWDDRYHHQRTKYAGTDHYSRLFQEYSARAAAAAADAKASAKANQSRPRRASHAAEGARPPPRSQTTVPKASPPKKPKASPPKQPRVATEEDARRAHIPAGFSLKHWDPAEEPITLLGSVFDANSLGKWIYDWASYCHGHGAPMTDLAGDMWLLLIQLAGKYRRADEAVESIRQEERREMAEDFLESGERLWVRFKKLLKSCEEHMYRAAQRESGEAKPQKVGANSGVAFVESMFGRDRLLDSTEKLMANIRLWSMRFDANVEPILQDPEA